MLCESEKRSKRTGNRRGAEVSTEKRSEAEEVRCPHTAWQEKLPSPSITQTLEELVRAYDFSVESAGDQCFAFDFARLAVGDGDVIHLERAPESALIVGFGFLEVGQGADFLALSVDEVALRLNDDVHSRSAELVFLLFRIKRLLLELPGFHSGCDLGAPLCEPNKGIAYVEKRGVP